MTCIQCNRKGLQFVPRISLRERNAWRLRFEERNKLAMVMALEVLEWGNWHIDRLVGDVVHRFTLWVAEEARIEQVNEIIIHIPGRCHALCFV